MNNFIKKQSDLPIISKLILTYKKWQEILIHFPKTSRSTLGAKIDLFLIQTLELIFISVGSSKQSKLPFLVKANFKLDLAKFFLQVAWQIKAIDNKKYIAVSSDLDEVGKMLGGWIKDLKKKLPLEAEE